MRRIIVATLSGTVLLGSLIAPSFASDSLNVLRNRYSTWQAKASTLPQAEQKKLLESLRQYPLYPYAKFDYLKQNFSAVSDQEIEQFLSTYADVPVSNDLRQRYLDRLKQTHSWSTLAKLPLDKASTATRCQVLYAKTQLPKQRKDALAEVKNLWQTGKSLPSSCDALLAEWRNAGLLSPALLMSRIDLALQNNNTGLALALAKQLPDDYQSLRKNLINVLSKPQTLDEFAKNISPSNLSRQVVMTMFPRLARADLNKAEQQLPVLVKLQKLSQTQQQTLQISLADRMFGDNVTPAQAKWRDQIAAKTGSVALIERRIRLALGVADYKQVEHWIKQLPKEARDKDDWQYWQAQLLVRQGKSKQAKQIWQKLSQNRGYYAMLSAQKLGQTYHFNFNYPIKTANGKVIKSDADLKKRLLSEPTIVRIKELHYWRQDQAARREWINFIYHEKQHQQLAELARYAFLQGWHAYSVQATIAGKLWDNWRERFPVAYKQQFEQALKMCSISKSYALAIARQESALDPLVASPAGARGLMQLMPGTAKEVAKKIALPNYHSSAQLQDPAINIKLGTAFLDSVYNRFDHNRILAAVAYNAGPGRVNRWLARSGGALSADAFVESIPFNETRNYVKNVLMYDYIYQLVLGQKPKALLTPREMNRSY